MGGHDLLMAVARELGVPPLARVTDIVNVRPSIQSFRIFPRGTGLVIRPERNACHTAPQVLESGQDVPAALRQTEETNQ
jgi:hypothetical protein